MNRSQRRGMKGVKLTPKKGWGLLEKEEQIRITKDAFREIRGSDQIIDHEVKLGRDIKDIAEDLFFIYEAGVRDIRDDGFSIQIKHG